MLYAIYAIRYRLVVQRPISWNAFDFSHTSTRGTLVCVHSVLVYAMDCNCNTNISTGIAILQYSSLEYTCTWSIMMPGMVGCWMVGWAGPSTCNIDILEYVHVYVHVYVLEYNMLLQQYCKITSAGVEVEHGPGLSF